ncbi:MAG: hypothetical protein IPK74_29810 [Deltaproteobacteria bacterium]|nr:hypothetical protein [Deltaproteobacteria bacterium]
MPARVVAGSPRNRADCGFVLVALALALSAPEPALSLQWRAPAGCPTADEIRARLADAEATATRSVEVVAEISQDGGQWHLALDRRSTAGHERDQMSAARCEVLADVVVLLATIALDPDATPRANTPPTRVRVGLGALATLDVGTLPRPRPGALAALRVFGRWWSVALRGSYLAAVQVRDRDDAALSAELSVWAVGLRGCATPAAKSVSFPLCVGPQFGGVRGRAEAGAATEAWVALDLGAGLVWSIAPRRLGDMLALLVDVDAVIGLRRPGFHFKGRASLARTGAIAVRPSLGLEVRFGRRGRGGART